MNKIPWRNICEGMAIKVMEEFLYIVYKIGIEIIPRRRNKSKREEYQRKLKKTAKYY